MAFGSVATSKVKVILEAQDNVTAKLNQLKANFAKADKELQTRIEKERYALAEKMVAWDQKHASPTGWYGFRSNTGQYWKSFEHFTPERTKALGMYNPYISGTSVFLALQTQSSKLYQNAQRFADGLISINQKLSKASAKLFEVGGKLTMSGGIMTGAGIAGLRSLYKPLSDFGDFQRNMLLTQAKATASAAEYNSMTGAARKYAANSSWDPQQVSSVMLEMASGGFKPEEIMNSFEQIMNYARAVGQDDPAWAARGIAAMLRAFHIDTSNQVKVSALIDKMTAAIVNSPLRDDTLREAMKQVGPMVLGRGGTFDDMMAWIMAMAQQGIDGSIAGTALKNFLVRTGKEADFMAGYGINVYDADGNRRSARNLLVDIGDVRSRLSGQQRDAFDARVFGMRSAAGINALFDNNAVENAYAVLNDANGMSDQIREHMESGVFGSLKRIWSALQDMFLEVGKSLEVTLKEMEPKIIEWFHWIKQQIEDMPSLVERAEKFFEWMTRIGIPVTAIGLAITGIGAVLNGIQVIASAIIFTVSNVLYPVVMGLAKFFVGIFTTCGAIGGALVVALAVITAIVGKTFRWGKIFQAMFNGGSILHGIKLIGWSLWESLKWASAKFYRLMATIFTWLTNALWKTIVFPIYGVMKAASYIPGLGAVGKAADFMLNAPGQMLDHAFTTVFDELDKENERTRKEYFKDLEKYSEAAKAQNTSEATDIAKRGVPVVRPNPQNRQEYLDELYRRDVQADADWERYVRPKDPFMIPPSDIKAREKIIAQYRKEEELEARAKEKAAAAAEAARKKELERAEALKKDREAAQEAARKKAVKEAKEKEIAERAANKARAEQVRKQAELTKNLKPIFQGSMEAAKWLHGLGEYSKDGKTERDLEQEQVDLLSGIYGLMENGEAVFQGV